MSKPSSENANAPIWTGKPWILPGAIGRTILVLIVAVVVILVESVFAIASTAVIGLPLALWTALLFFLIWLFSLFHLLLLRASNNYVLRNDSLEVKSGILATKSFVIVASGFADLQVDRSVSGRIVGSGDIIIRSQSESNVVMVRVRDPLKVAEQIRKVMARPIVRIEGQEPWEKKN